MIASSKSQGYSLRKKLVLLFGMSFLISLLLQPASALLPILYTSLSPRPFYLGLLGPFGYSQPAVFKSPNELLFAEGVVYRRRGWTRLALLLDNDLWGPIILDNKSESESTSRHVLPFRFDGRSGTGLGLDAKAFDEINNYWTSLLASNPSLLRDCEQKGFNTVIVDFVGWPRKAAWGVWGTKESLEDATVPTIDASFPNAIATRAPLYGSASHISSVHGGVEFSRVAAIPVRAWWANVFYNTIILAGAVLCLVLAIKALWAMYRPCLQVMRSKQGRCCLCGHPAQCGNSVCTECGAKAIGESPERHRDPQ